MMHSFPVRFRPGTGSASPSEHDGGSYYDSDSLRSRGSRGSERLKVSDSNYAIQRLLEDLGKGAFINDVTPI